MEGVMSGRVYLLGVGTLLVAGALLMTDCWFSRRPGITWANFQRIQRGMSYERVMELLGGPGGDYLTGPGSVAGPPVVVDFLDDEEPGWRTWMWMGDGGLIRVTFTQDNEVASKAFAPVSSSAPNTFSRLRAWLAGLAGNLPHDAGNLK
jgi:hypothetical protein